MPVTVTNNNAIESHRKKLAHIKGGLVKATARAVSRTATQGRTQISKEIRQRVAIKAKDLKPSLEVKRQKGSAKITIRELERLSLRHFSPKQNAKGVSYKINKTGSRTHVKGAFQGPRPGVMKASWRGNVFRRQGDARLPIVKLQGVSAWGTFVANDLYNPTRRDLQKKFKSRLKHEVDYLVKTGGQRNG